MVVQVYDCAQPEHDCEYRRDGKCTAIVSSYAYCANARIAEMRDELAEMFDQSENKGYVCLCSSCSNARKILGLPEEGRITLEILEEWKKGR